MISSKPKQIKVPCLVQDGAIYKLVVNGYIAFTTFTKSSILDVTGPDPSLNFATLRLIIGTVQFFKWYHQNLMLFQKFQLVIIGAVQILKWYHQNCLIFDKLSARDNMCILNFQVTSTKLPRDNTGSSNIEVTSLNLFFSANIWAPNIRCSWNF